MATSSPVYIPREEYLNTTYRPDRDWIDGETREHTMGEQPHTSIQGFFTQLFRNKATEWQVRVFPKQSVQPSAANYRIPAQTSSPN